MRDYITEFGEKPNMSEMSDGEIYAYVSQKNSSPELNAAMNEMMNILQAEMDRFEAMTEAEQAEYMRGGIND